MAFLPYPPTSIDGAIGLFKQDSQIAHDVVHGSETTQVLTENGLVPSFAKAIKDLTDEVEAATGVDVSLRNDLANVNSTVSIAGIVANKLKAQYNDFISVKDLGAAGNGTDATSAFQIAFNSSNTKPVIIPAGDYVISSNITASNRLVMLGSSSTLTRITFKNGSRIVYTPTTQQEYGTQAQLVVEGITFLTETNSAQTCFEASWVAGIGGTSSTVLCKDCNFSGVDGTTSWKYAFDLTNARNTYFENIRILGDRSSTPVQASGGIRIKGADSGVEHFFHNVRVYFVDSGLVINQTAEGAYVTSCAFVKVRTGILGDSGAAGAMEPLITVSGCHFNVFEFGAYLRNYVQSIFKGNLVYNQIDSGAFVSSALVGFYLKNDSASVPSDIVVSGNVFKRIAGSVGASTGCYILGGSHYDVSHNNFNGYDQGIYVEDGVAAVTEYNFTDNFYTGCPIKITGSGTGFTPARERKTPAMFTHVLTMPASGATTSFDIPIPKGTTSTRPDVVILTPASPPEDIRFWYSLDQSTNTFVRVFAAGTLASQSIRLSVLVS